MNAVRPASGNPNQKGGSARRSGRPPRDALRDPREILLDASLDLIARQGVAATSSADIAARAGVTPAMVHYYFRNRELLLDAVVRERIARFPAYVFGEPLPPGRSASEFVTLVVARLFEAARLMPWMPPIWIREIASEGGLLRERILAHFPAGKVEAIVGAIAQEQREGHVPAGVEPRLMLVTLAGLAMLPMAVLPVLRRLPGLQDIDEATLQRHATAVLTGGLVPLKGTP